MNILIIENEIYLAQKVVSRLLDDGHNCDFVESTSVNLTKDYDTILLSTSLPSSDVNKIISQYKDSIIILLVSYISDETVTNPIKAGAKDYIMKPFIMDELVRKIYHFRDCRALRQELITMKSYLDFNFNEVNTSNITLPIEFPILIETNSQKCAEKIAFDYSKKLAKPLRFISLEKENWQKDLILEKKYLYFLSGYHTLKKSSKDLLHTLIEEFNVIVCTLEADNDFPYEKIKFDNNELVVINDNIMTINDYVKLMVMSFQNKYPDTELSKKLGISRKSLWEKRKKLGIEKKK